MINFQIELKQHVASGGNCVNLGRTLAAKHPAIYNWVMESTEFLNDRTGIKFNERVYCLINDLSSRPVNALGEPAVFDNLFTGYAMKTCSADRKIKAQQRAATKIQSTEEANMALNKLQQQYQYWASRVGSSDYDLGKKIHQHVSGWHTGAGKNYYTDSAQEGVDYVVCPITQLRKCSITLHYAKVLGFSTIEEYLAVAGPDTQLRANAHSQRISSALKVVDPETGMTKHQISHTKTIATLSQKDHTGLTGYDRIGIKTRATHMANVDELGRNGYKKLADDRKVNIRESGLTVQEESVKKHRETTVANFNAGKTSDRRAASKLSIKHLLPVVDFLKRNNIDYYFDTNEYTITCPDTGRNYKYDLTISSLKIAIEFQSNAYHADPKMTDEQWSMWKPKFENSNYSNADQSAAYDFYKASLIYRTRGYIVFHVWENSANDDVNLILCYIQTNYTKYAHQVDGKDLAA